MDPLLLLMFPVFLLSLTIHEVAHAWTAKLGGDRTSDYLGRISFNPLVHVDPLGTVILPILLVLGGLPPFGWAKPVPVNTLRLRHSGWMVYVALAGPLSNFLIILVTVVLVKLFSLLGLITPAPNLGTIRPDNIIWVMGILIIHINLVLALFNLIPIPPLDGSRVAYHFLIRGNPKLEMIWMSLEGFAGMIIVYLAMSFPPIRSAFGWVIGTIMNALLSLIT